MTKSDIEISARRVLLAVLIVCSLSAPLMAQDPALRDCNQHQYPAETLVFRVELFGEQISRLVETNADFRKSVQTGTGQDVTGQIYAEGLLQKIPDCTEPVVHVRTGNQVPGSTGGAATGFTVIINAMPKFHCEAMYRSHQRDVRQRPFAVRFEPPGNSSKWRLGECADNPVLGILTLGRALPQPNTAYLFFPVDLRQPTTTPPPMTTNNRLCDLSAMLGRVNDPAKRAALEDLFLRMAGALSELSDYRQSFLNKGLLAGLVDLFPAVYYHMTQMELERIKNNEYQYPDVKLKQIIAFYDSYKRNREAYDRALPVEDQWRVHFQKVAEVQKSLYRILEPDPVKNGVQEVLDTGMQAHIVFDFPRALRSAFDSSGGRGPSWKDLEADFFATEKLFPTAMERSMSDIRSRPVGDAVAFEAFFGSVLAYITEGVRSVLPGSDLQKLDPRALTVDYIKDVRSLAWSRAQQGPPWPWPLEKQFESSPKDMRTKGETFCSLPSR